ncbi:kinase-like domain-containing protein [Xylaria telfairii]|nr:kinase-like domain-containing protein [Xylaria telfairii]
MASEPKLPIIWPKWNRGWHPEKIQEPDGPIRIRNYGIGFENDNTQPDFYPLPLLQHIFDRKVLSLEVNALQGLDQAAKDSLVGRVLGLGDSGLETYIKVFAILKLMGQLERLPAFVRERVADQELPLYRPDRVQRGDRPFYGKSKKPLPDGLLDEYGWISFEREQYSVTVPTFDYQSEPYELVAADVLPYYKVTQTTTSTSPTVSGTSGASTTSSERSGGSGSVSKILIHPLCHKFYDTFRKLEVPDEEIFFALKKFRNDNDTSFRQEVKMLQAFNSTKHLHIMALLAAFTLKSENFLIFPWADHDLHMYWKKVRPKPDATDAKLVRWISRQAWKLVEAVSCIHALPEDKSIPETGRLYGRHGDLKPENILWYKSRKGFGNLVIADMGLSKTHKFASKTYTMRPNVQATPRYRPPEIEYEDGKMGRTFDIWTLGCTFFEMANWLHGGYTELENMVSQLMAGSIRGFCNDVYYEWVHVEDAKFYTIRVKEAVTEKIQALRQECSGFVFDFLGVIQQNMLVIDRDDRASAEALVKDMKNLHRKCEEDAYCIRKETRERLDGPKPKLKKRGFAKNLKTVGKDNVPQVYSTSFS